MIAMKRFKKNHLYHLYMVEIQRKVYSNGLIATAIPLEGKTKIAFSVGIDVGAKNESTERKGCAHLLEHMMFRSNDFRTSDQLAEAVEFSGMDINARTSLTETTLAFQLPPEKLGLAIELAYQSIVSKSYNVDEFETEKNGPVTTELVGHERTPGERYFRRILLPRVFKGTPFGDAVIGTFVSVRGLQIPDLIAMKKEFYHPNNMVVAAAGAVNSSLFFDLLESSFGSLPSCKVTQPTFFWNLRAGTKNVEFDDFKDPKNELQDQASVSVVYQVNDLTHPDAVGLSLVQMMVGGGFTSWLFRELRKERGIGYTPKASYTSRRGKAVLMMRVPELHPNRLEESVGVMEDMVQRLKLGKIDQRFLEGKKTQMRSSLMSLLEESSVHVGSAIAKEFDKPYYTLESSIEAIDKMTLGYLQDVLRRNLNGDPLIVIASAPGYRNRFCSEFE